MMPPHRVRPPTPARTDGVAYVYALLARDQLQRLESGEARERCNSLEELFLNQAEVEELPYHDGIMRSPVVRRAVIASWKRSGL